MLQSSTEPHLPSISPSSLLPAAGQAQPTMSNSRGDIKAQMVQIQKQMQHMFEDVKDNIQNKNLERNNCIFGVLLILLQIGIALFYAFFIKVYVRPFIIKPTEDQNQLKYIFLETFQPVAICLLTFVIVVIGFGCLFAYHRKLLWSALTYNLLIVCLTVQIYPIVNYVINKIRNNSPDGFLFLSNYQQYTYTNVNIDGSLITFTKNQLQYQYQLQKVGKCLLDSLKCSISNCVIFSALLGRAGLLDSLFVSVFATIGYQINKEILYGLGVDFADANSMFTFGGFCGLGIGLAIYIKNKLVRTRCNKNKNYTGSLFSIAISIFGCAVLLALFPILVLHYPQNWEITTPTIISNAPYCVYSSMAASTMMSIGASIIINKKTIVRDLINGTIAGGIAILNSCPFIIVPAYAQIVGAFAGLLQVFVANFIQKRIARDKQIVTTFSFCLFGVQGVVGAAFASLWRIIATSNPDAYGSDWSNYISNSWRIKGSYPIVFAGISAGIGFGVGVVIGLVISLLSTYRRSDSMHDSVGFKVEDGQNFKQFESEIQEQMNKQQQLGPVMIPFK